MKIFSSNALKFFRFLRKQGKIPSLSNDKMLIKDLEVVEYEWNKAAAIPRKPGFLTY
jgi:hypothetical protein